MFKSEKVLQHRPEGVRGVVDDLYEAQKEIGEDVFSEESIYHVIRDLTTAGKYKLSMYMLCCSLYNSSVEVATCTTSLYSLCNLYKANFFL